ncbi:MAG: hypothetical protein M3Q52_04455 [Pseudomonadota bacterium]|nr:hypothetical protein [Pseudomonadota bacterium]
MAHRKMLLALCMIAAASPASASTQAPAGSAETRYCMRIEAITGTHIEEVLCWTRVQWAEQGVDVDKDWPEEGVRTIG